MEKKKKKRKISICRCVADASDALGSVVPILDRLVDREKAFVAGAGNLGLLIIKCLQV